MSSLETLCQKNGLRITRSCRRVLAVIEAAADHPSAQEIHGRVAANQRVARGTVYRILNKLTDNGILTRHAFGDGRMRYESAARRHHHLVDVRSGAIVEMEDRELALAVELAASRLGYSLLDFKLEVTAIRKTSSNRDDLTY